MALKIKENQVKLNEPAQKEEIAAVFDEIHTFDTNILAKWLRKDDLKHNTALHDSWASSVNKVLMCFKWRSAWIRVVLLQGTSCLNHT